MEEEKGIKKISGVELEKELIKGLKAVGCDVYIEDHCLDISNRRFLVILNYETEPHKMYRVLID